MEKKKLIKEISDQLEILLTIAIPRESDAYKMYVGLANKSTIKHVKDMYIELAKQEIGHKKYLEDIKSGLLKRLDELKEEL